MSICLTSIVLTHHNYIFPFYFFKLILHKFENYDNRLKETFIVREKKKIHIPFKVSCIKKIYCFQENLLILLCKWSDLLFKVWQMRICFTQFIISEITASLELWVRHFIGYLQQVSDFLWFISPIKTKHQTFYLYLFIKAAIL